MTQSQMMFFGYNTRGNWRLLTRLGFETEQAPSGTIPFNLSDHPRMLKRAADDEQEPNL